MELRKAETEQITEAIVSNQSLLVLGEPGAGIRAADAILTVPGLATP